MARPPEILEQQPYTKSADVYSFAITLFESFIEASPFPQKQFQNPWDITNFITSGKRPAFPKEMHPKYARIIEACWHQNPARRPSSSLFPSHPPSRFHRDSIIPSSTHSIHPGARCSGRSSEGVSLMAFFW